MGPGRLVLPRFGLWLALLVGAALAPTDAALGIPVVTNPAVPSRIRQLITVESGLNDGIATPVVMVAIAGAAAAAGLEGAAGPGSAAVALLIGAGVGAAPEPGGWLLQLARRSGTCRRGLRRHRRPRPEPARLHRRPRRGRQRVRRRVLRRSGVRRRAGQRGPAELVFLEQMGGLVSLLVWLAFGAISVPTMLRTLSP